VTVLICLEPDEPHELHKISESEDDRYLKIQAKMELKIRTEEASSMSRKRLPREALANNTLVD
jgi:hypothetical protein